MPAKLKTGSILEVEFLDHVEDGGDPLRFIVWGRLEKVGKKHLEICSWATSSEVERLPANEKMWTIVRSAITKIEILKA